MIQLINVDLTHAETIKNLAEEIWWPTYSPILSDEQIRFMLDKFYSIEALENTIRSQSQHFILLQDQHGPQAFAAYGPVTEQPATMKLHKLYVRLNNQGKGYGKILVEEVKNRSLRELKTDLILNVNRYNPAKNFYEKIGFHVIKEEDIPVGPYWMNDYVLKLGLG
jgi:diamine N-acetyltransferase